MEIKRLANSINIQTNNPNETLALMKTLQKIEEEGIQSMPLSEFKNILNLNMRKYKGAKIRDVTFGKDA